MAYAWLDRLVESEVKVGDPLSGASQSVGHCSSPAAPPAVKIKVRSNALGFRLCHRCGGAQRLSIDSPPAYRVLAAAPPASIGAMKWYTHWAPPHRGRYRGPRHGLQTTDIRHPSAARSSVQQRGQGWTAPFQRQPPVIPHPSPSDGAFAIPRAAPWRQGAAPRQSFAPKIGNVAVRAGRGVEAISDIFRGPGGTRPSARDSGKDRADAHHMPFHPRARSWATVPGMLPR